MLPSPGHQKVGEEHEEHRHQEEGDVYLAEMRPHLAPVHTTHHEVEADDADQQAEGYAAEVHEVKRKT